MGRQETTRQSDRRAGWEEERKEMKEMSRDEAEKAAARMPLPSFESQEDEIWHAQQFAGAHTRSVACIVLGLSSNTLKSAWKRARRHDLESKRFRNWCEVTMARWDAARGKFLVHFPEGAHLTKPARKKGKV